MAILRTDTVSGIGTEGTVFEGDITFDSLNYMTLPKGTTTEASFNYAGVPAASARGLWAGGQTPSVSDVIDYVTIATTGNATDFGNLESARHSPAAVASPTRGVMGGGYPSINTMQYVTIASTGNSKDFGDLPDEKNDRAGASNSTRGLFAGGYTAIKNIYYIQIQSQGNSTNFGNLTAATQAAGGCASPTRALFGGGSASGNTNVIEYVTIATTSNATDFGDLTDARGSLGNGASSQTRGLWSGGYSPGDINIIDYVTIASVGNATDFGDLTVARSQAGGTSSTIRGIFGGGIGGSPSRAALNTIDYVTIATTGNATDYGDLTVARNALTACSNGHGGLG